MPAPPRVFHGYLPLLETIALRTIYRALPCPLLLDWFEWFLRSSTILVPEADGTELRLRKDGKNNKQWILEEKNGNTFSAINYWKQGLFGTAVGKQIIGKQGWFDTAIVPVDAPVGLQWEENAIAVNFRVRFFRGDNFFSSLSFDSTRVEQRRLSAACPRKIHEKCSKSMKMHRFWSRSFSFFVAPAGPQS